MPRQILKNLPAGLHVTDLDGGNPRSLIPRDPPPIITLIAETGNAVKGYNLDAIPDNWQANNNNLLTVQIGNRVTSIGSYGFAYCSALTSVTIPDSIGGLGSKSFYTCTALTSVTIPDSVTSIGMYGFAHNAALTSVTIGKNLTSHALTFAFCSSLNTVYAHCPREALVGVNAFIFCATPFTIHARASDDSWTAGADTLDGVDVTVVKDL